MAGRKRFLPGELLALPVALSAALLWGWLAGSGSIQAATFTVSTTQDSRDGVCDAHCSLREAIEGASPGDVIDIPPGTYTLTEGLQLTIDRDLTLRGAGAQQTVIQAAAQPGAGDFHPLHIARGTVAISGVTVRHGSPGTALGGGIYNGGSLTLTDSVVRDNRSGGAGGGIFNAPGSRLVLLNSTVSHNLTLGTWGDGGGIRNEHGEVLLLNSTVSGNQTAGVYGDGGGMHHNGGTAILLNSTIGDNYAGSSGGGLWSRGQVLSFGTVIVGNGATASSPDCYTDSSLFPVISLGQNQVGDSSGCGNLAGGAG